ncbi:TorF family putative porin [Limnohabitans sp. DM1]|uniref:TorF family putative porin n=1 Tax=Limnohabitans sp. DM1 TaxID=1597955 RepID=UPI000B0D237F|nr:TorF family putative porin [Limnohabitans sp. DM1]
MKKILVPSLIAWAISALAPVAHAQTAPASSLSFNAGVVSDYRYRGISQSRLEPALQGGVDYADKSGFYVGAWGSSIKWIKDAGTLTDTAGVKGSVEVDLYGGYKGTAGDVAYDVGFLRYEYVGNTLKDTGYANASTHEVYGALTYGLFTAKYSHAISNLFGNNDSKNSYYIDLSAALDLGDGYSLVPHVGYQKIKNWSEGSYTDYALTLGKDLGGGLSASAAVIGTDAKKDAYVSPAGKQLGKAGVVLGLKYSF